MVSIPSSPSKKSPTWPRSLSLWKSSWRFMLSHRWQTGLSFIGIALGVAIVVAVDLANQSASKAFSLTLNSVTGQVTHQIVPNDGSIDEQLFVRLRTHHTITRSAPRVQAHIKWQGENFTLLGVDPISEISLGRHGQAFSQGAISDLLQQSTGVVLLSQTAQRLGINIGDSFTVEYRGRPLPLTLSAVYEHSNQAALEAIIFTDIANAQHLLGRRGQLDHIDLNLTSGQSSKLRNWLPAQYRLLESQARNHGLLSMSQAFTTNLTAMSLLALLVGALLIYNTVNFAALRRRAMVGTYRALGVTRSELLYVLLSETLILATLASIAGTLLGILLSQYLLQFVTQTFNDLYFALTVKKFFLIPLSLIKGISLGIVVSLLVTLVPVLASSRVPAINLQRRSETEQDWQKRINTLTLIGIASLIVGYLYSLIPRLSLTSGFISLAIMAIGFCFIVPGALRLCCRLLEKNLASRMSIHSRLALRGVSSGISRTGIAVAALSVALATVIGVTIMITSFRETVVVWLDQSLRGDIFISIPGSSRRNYGTGIPESLINQLRQLDEVTHVTSLRTFRSETDMGRLLSISHEPFTAYPPAAILEQQPHALERYIKGEGIYISEPLAYHQQLSSGDNLQIYTQQGPQSFTVLGIFRDYRSSRGIIALPTKLLQTYWQPVPINGLLVQRKSTTTQTDLMAAVRQLLAKTPEQFRLSSNQAVRSNTLAVFDRTFLITHVLRLLVLVVAFTGLLSALLALQLEKSREYAILRATGMTHWQLGGLILQQTSLLGIFSALFALPLGCLLADRLIHVINRRSFGWSMEQTFPLEVIPQSLLLAICAALLAAIYPIWALKNKPIASALHEE